MKTERFTNQDVAELLRGIAGAYQLKDGNKFKIIAYDRAADTIEHLSREVHDVWQEGNLNKIPTLGASIRSSLEELFKTGKVKHFEEILKGIPAPVFELMKVPSIGPKKALKLVEALKLSNPKTIIEDLQHAAKLGKIATIPAFGVKSQEDIVEALGLYDKNKTKERRMPLPIAYSVAERIIEHMKHVPSIKRADALGSLRRMVSTIGDVDVAVGIEGNDTKPVIEHFLKYPSKIRVDNAGENKASIIIPPNTRVDLRVQPIDNYGPMIQYFTGGKSHNINLREFALKKGLSLNEYGIKEMKTGKVHPFKTEEEFYHFLGLSYIPPEIREGSNEIELAKKNEIPHLVELKDIKGDMHLHSSYDLKPSHDFGKDTYKDLLIEAEKYGYEYIALSDHNPRMSKSTENEIVEIMKKRQDHIIKTCPPSVSKTKYFISLETDILPDGTLALPEKAIAYVDFLLISIHSVFNLGVKEMTQRLLKAMTYPKVKIIGHPTGRLLGKRPGYELDWPTIFAEVKKRDIALEINSWTDRLDLPDSLVREGKNHGVKFVIDTDSHAKEQMINMRYGVAVARRGWLTKHDIINTRNYNELKNWIVKD